jgi:hypothetical protein
MSEFARSSSGRGGCVVRSDVVADLPFHTWVTSTSAQHRRWREALPVAQLLTANWPRAGRPAHFRHRRR